MAAIVSNPSRTGTDHWSLFLRQQRLKDQLRRLRNDWKDCYCPLDCQGAQHSQIPADVPPQTPRRQPQAGVPHPLHGPHVPVDQPLPNVGFRQGLLLDPNTTILAEARGTSDIYLTRAGTRATLRISLQVHTDPCLRGRAVRTGYYAEIFLTQPGQGERHIGYINSWHVDRSTQDWQAHLLDNQRGEARDDFFDMREFFRALFPRGGPRQFDDNRNILPAAPVRQHYGARWAMLRDDSDLIYMHMIWIDHQFSGNRIIDQAFDLFYRLMVGGTLPAPYNLTRPLSLVLEPGLFEDDAGQVWRNLADGAHPSIADVVTTLARTYARNGYMRFRQGGGQPGLRAGGEHMGRRVEAQDHPAAPGDRAIIPPAPADMAPGASSPSPARVPGSPGSTQASSPGSPTPSGPRTNPSRPVRKQPGRDGRNLGLGLSRR